MRRESGLTISEALSEKLDDVMDLENLSKFEKGKNQKSLISQPSSFITDYDLGSLMDVKLQQ